MKNLKKAVLSAFAVAVGFGAVVANNTSGIDIWRVASGSPDNVAVECTLAGPGQLCSVQFPSSIKTTMGSSAYFVDAGLTQRIETRVFLAP